MEPFDGERFERTVGAFSSGTGMWVLTPLLVISFDRLGAPWVCAGRLDEGCVHQVNAVYGALTRGDAQRPIAIRSC
jgi:hypothetical protein